MDRINQIDDDAWIKAREEEVEAMWAATLAPMPRVEIPEDELPF